MRSYWPEAPLSTASSASQLAWISLRMRKRTGSGRNQPQQGNLGWRADAYGNPDGADASAYIERRRGSGWPALAVAAVHIRSHKSCDVQGMAENLDRNL